MPIVGIQPDRVQQGMQKMETVDASFYLTGSRFFGTNRENSDWDFYTANNDSVKKQLLSLGFYELRKTGRKTVKNMRDYQYVDDNITTIFRHPYGIDIQFQKDVELKTRAQALVKILKENMKPVCLDHVVWNTAYMIIKLC